MNILFYYGNALLVLVIFNDNNSVINKFTPPFHTNFVTEITVRSLFFYNICRANIVTLIYFMVHMKILYFHIHDMV